MYSNANNYLLYIYKHIMYNVIENKNKKEITVVAKIVKVTQSYKKEETNKKKKITKKRAKFHIN